ncbi:MAG: hypothetical protein ACRCVT_01875 [Leadbetterella sp.]
MGAIKHTLSINFRCDRKFRYKRRKIIIVPKGIEHRPLTNGELVFNLLFVPIETEHTGKVIDKKTVTDLEWI